LRHVTTGLLPVTVNGDVQWALNRLENGGWLVTIFNNSGILKPQHGVLPTDHSKAQTVTIRSAYPVKSSQEWMTEDKPQWSSGSGNREQWNTQITVPAGAPRIIEMRP